jgi:hypothetical protein
VIWKGTLNAIGATEVPTIVVGLAAALADGDVEAVRGERPGSTGGDTVGRVGC